MGGRGASSSISKGIKAISIDFGNGTTSSYRMNKNGVISDLDNNGVVNTNGKSLTDIAKRAEKLGYKVSTYDSKQIERYDKDRERNRKETSKQLNDYTVRGYTPRKGWKGY